MENTYRNLWTSEIEKFKQIIENNPTSDEMVSLIQKFVILTDLAIDEINKNETPENRDRACGNVGLDLASMILQNMILYSIQHKNMSEILDMIKNTQLMSIEEKIYLISQ